MTQPQQNKRKNRPFRAVQGIWRNPYIRENVKLTPCLSISIKSQDILSVKITKFLNR